MSLYTKLQKFLKPLLRFFFRTRVCGMPEELPEGPLVICSNHISLWDPLFYLAFLDRPLTFMAKQEIFRVPILRTILKKIGAIPLSRDGGDAAMLRLAVREVKGGAALAIFPQGTRCHVPCEETSVKGGTGLLVSLSGATVLPVGIFAKNYRVRPFRRTVLCFGEPKVYEVPALATRKDEIGALTQAIFSDITSLSVEAEKIALSSEKGERA